MENIIVAITNLASVYTVHHSPDNLTTFAIINAAGWSFVSHVFASHKHGQWGFGANQSTSRFLNFMDIVAAVGLVFRSLFVWRASDVGLRLLSGELIAKSILSFVLLRVSEMDQTPATKTRFVVLHSMWHIMAFLTLGDFFKAMKIAPTLE